jgi:hypothetical protein
MGSIIRKFFFLWSLQAGIALVCTIVLASSELNFVLILVLARLAVVWLGFLVYIVIFAFSVNIKGWVGSAEEYVSYINHSQTEYCLILRPFGADGFIPISVDPPADKLSRVMMRIFGLGSWKMSKTAEQIIGETVTNVLNCETVALVDPKLKLVPSSPKFISTDNSSWQRIIELLLRRALVVFLILPPQKRVTSSVRWEVERIAALGLGGRFIIVLPPPNRSDYGNSYESAKELADLFPVIHGMPDKVIVAWPYTDLTPFLLGKVKKRERIGELTYVSALKYFLNRIKFEMDGCPLPLRYQYNWRNVGTPSIKNQSSLHESHLKLVHDDDDWPELIG